MEIRLDDPRPVRLQRAGMPFVTIGRTARPHGMCWVDIDYATLIGRCVDHLADLGHRAIALINRPAELVSSGYGPGHRAGEGFAGAVARRGIEGSEFCCADHARGGQACVEEILRTHPEVTAIATINERRCPASSERWSAPGWRSQAGSPLPESRRGTGPSSSILSSPRPTCRPRTWGRQQYGFLSSALPSRTLRLGRRWSRRPSRYGTAPARPDT
jgi:hypothetical protein